MSNEKQSTQPPSPTAHAIQMIRDDERDKIVAWLDTFPWKGPGTPSIGDIMRGLMEGAHRE